MQQLASHVLRGQKIDLKQLQKKMESQQATLAELLRVLRPKQLASQHHDGSQHRAMNLPPGSLLGNGKPYSMMESNMSVMKGWDLTSGSKSNGGKNSKRGGKHSAKNQQLTRKERYQAVESFWRGMDESEQLTCLNVPVKKVLEVVPGTDPRPWLHAYNDSLFQDTLYSVYREPLSSSSSKMEDVLILFNEETIIYALRLLKRNASHHACYWSCPSCQVRIYDGRGFLDHLATHHETVQYACEDTPLLCTTCAQEIVGAFYFAGELSEPTGIRCIRCAW